MSDTLWVAIITGILTTVPPIITAIINNRKELKLKQFEFYKQQQLNAVVDFLNSVGEISNPDTISLKEKSNFQKATNKLLLYFPALTKDMITTIYNSVNKWDVGERYEAIQPLIKELSKSIKDK